MAVSDTGPGRAAESAASVEIDPERSLAEPNPDSILANAVCCIGLPGQGYRCNPID
jgi:hypothetical protein